MKTRKLARAFEFDLKIYLNIFYIFSNIKKPFLLILTNVKYCQITEKYHMIFQSEFLNKEENPLRASVFSLQLQNQTRLTNQSLILPSPKI